MVTERHEQLGSELPDRTLTPDEIIPPRALESAGSQAPWAHTAVYGRFRVNTAQDRKQALAEAFRLFFERTDGTNALDDDGPP